MNLPGLELPPSRRRKLITDRDKDRRRMNDETILWPNWVYLLIFKRGTCSAFAGTCGVERCILAPPPQNRLDVYLSVMMMCHIHIFWIPKHSIRHLARGAFLVHIFRYCSYPEWLAHTPFLVTGIAINKGNCAPIGVNWTTADCLHDSLTHWLNDGDNTTGDLKCSLNLITHSRTFRYNQWRSWKTRGA